MKLDRHSFRPLATFVAGLFALVACQNTTDSNDGESGSIMATASYTMASSSRLPDSVTWTAPKDSGSHRTRCVALNCYDTFQLSEPLGTDSLELQLWTLGIRTYTLYFGEKGSSTTLDRKARVHCDILDTLLLSRYDGLTTAQKASFSALGQGASSLVAYYASLLLADNTSFVGKSLPVGMSQDSVEKALVYLAGKQGSTVSQLLAKDLSLDSATVLQNVKLLIKAGVLSSADSAAIFPPYPVRVKSSIAVKGTLTAGGDDVSVSGAFAWTKGQNIKAPVIQVRTSKPGDSVNFSNPTNKFASTDTIWNLDGNLSIKASSSAAAGTDTLVVTISDDAGHSATSRTAFQVISSAAAPTISPNGGTFYNSQNVTVAAASADSIQISTDSVSWTKYSSAVVVSTSEKLYARAFKGGAASPVTSAAFVIGTVPVPSFTPNGGSFYGADTVVVAAAGADSIQVSTDSANWTKYTAKIVVTSTGKFYARAFKGGVASAVVSVAFTSSTVPVPTIAPNGGTFYAVQTVAITGPTGTDSVQTSTDSATWTKYTQAISITASGQLHARSFIGGVASPVVSAVFTIGTVPVPAISPNGGTFYSAQNATVSASGTDSIETSTDSATWVKYASGVTVAASEKLYARAFKGGVASTVVSASFTIAAVPLPVLSPNGGTVSTTQDIAVTATGADSIQTSPDSSTWTKYTSSLHVAASGKLYARAFKGGVASTVVSASFTVPPVPVITPNGGPFTTSQSVTISIPATTGAVIQVSVDNGSWTTYSAFSVNVNAKIRARTMLSSVASTVAEADFAFPPSFVDSIANDSLGNANAGKVTLLAPGSDSIVVSGDNLHWTKLVSGDTYQMTATGTLQAFAMTGNATSSKSSLAVQIFQRPPSIISGGVFAAPQQVTITASKSDIQIFYTTNGTVPTTSTSSTTFKYSTPFTVTDSARIKAIGVKSGIVNSAVASDSVFIASQNDYGVPWQTGITYGAIRDTRDSKVYRTVAIGTQTWMAQNLNYKTDSSWCSEDNAELCAEYGRLYSWSAAMKASDTYDHYFLNAKLPHQGVCPSGWHVPSDAEWSTLTTYIGGEESAGINLKSTSGWLLNRGSSGNGTDTYGFRVLPSGFRNSDGSINSIGYTTMFWSASESAADSAWYRDVSGSSVYVIRSSLSKAEGHSLRCLQD